MQRKVKNFVILLPILSGFLGAFAYPPTQFSWLTGVFLIPLLSFTLLEKDRKRIFWGGFAGGLLYAAIILRWVLFTFPLDWLGVPDAIAAPGLVFFWLTPATIIGIFWGFFALLLVAPLDNQRLHALVAVPALWILAEYGWAWATTLLWAGPGTLLGPHWLFGSFSDMLAAFPHIMQITRLGGQFLGSAFVVFANITLLHASVLFINAGRQFPNKLKNTISITIAGVFIGTAYFYGLLVTNGMLDETTIKLPFKIAVLQTNAPPLAVMESVPNEELWNKHFLLAQKAAEENPDVIVFPENVGFFSQKPLLAPAILNALSSGTKPLLAIDVGRQETINTTHLKVYYLDTQKGLVGQHDKMLLVPNGEYVPYLTRVIARIFNKEHLIEIIEKQRYYSKSAVKQWPVEWQNVSFGTLPCSGVFSPIMYRNITTQGSEILVNTAGHAIFQKSPAFSAQVEAKSKVQAASLARPFIQASNGGFSFVLNKNGRVISKNATIGEGFLVEDIAPSQEKTLFQRLGNWPVPVSIALFVLSFVLLRYPHIQRMAGHMKHTKNVIISLLK